MAWGRSMAGGAIVALAVLAGSRGAIAAGGNEVEASRLFREGRAKMADGQYAEACALFERSLELDPEPGTALNLALCDEQIGRLASAWYMWLRAATLAGTKGQQERQDLARARAGKLEARLPRLRIDLTPQRQGQTVEAWVDGQPLGQDRWGAALPINPGLHRVEARSGGCQSWFTDVVADEGKTASVTIPFLESLDTGGTRRTGALLVGAGAMAAVALGSVFGVGALVANTQVGPGCAPERNVGCTASDLHHWSEVQTYGAVADVGFAVGVVGAIGAAFLWFGAPHRTTSGAAWSVRPLVGPAFASLSVAGAW